MQIKCIAQQVHNGMAPRHPAWLPFPQDTTPLHRRPASLHLLCISDATPWVYWQFCIAESSFALAVEFTPCTFGARIQKKAHQVVKRAKENVMHLRCKNGMVWKCTNYISRGYRNITVCILFLCTMCISNRTPKPFRFQFFRPLFGLIFALHT